MNDLIKALAPTIAGFIGGPIGLIAESGIEFLADKLGAKAKTVESITETLQGMTATDQIKLKQLDYDFQKFCLENSIKVQLAQISVDTEEAKSTNWFVAGWRPFVGWICGAGLAYVSILEPIMRFIAKVAAHYEGPFPVIDTTLTMQVLIGMLGLGVMRTAEKMKDAEGNR